MEQNIVFTDIDGTVIDYSTYSFEDALCSIDLIKKLQIPLIFCSSKTRAEIEELRKKMQIFYPFISENGGGLFIPKDCFKQPFHYHREEEGYQIIELGVPYRTLCRVFKDIKKKLGFDIKGFSDMSPEEVSDICGLTLDEALLAKKREYDEPFVIDEDESLYQSVFQEIETRGYHYTRGGRFFHLTGKNDKGKAVEILTSLYRKEYSHIRTIGIGDSYNDRELLQEVDVPVLVQKPDGTYDPSVTINGLIKASGIGPKGWNNYLMDYLKDN